MSIAKLDGRNFDRNTLLKRNGAVVFAEVEGQAVMMDLKKGLYFGLDQIGTNVWNRIESATTVAELSSLLSREYEADPETIERDLMALIAMMADHNLVEAY